MADSDVPEAIQANAEVEALVDPTVSDLWRTLHGYTPEAMAATAAKQALSGGGGSLSLVNVVTLELSPVVLFTAGGAPPSDTHFVEWQTIYDRGQNELDDMPVAMGLHLGTSAFIDANPAIIIDEPGMWCFELMANPTADATAIVDITLGNQGIFTGGPRMLRNMADWDGLDPGFQTTPEICLNSQGSLVAGNEVYVRVAAAAATASPYALLDYAAMQIIRLA